MDAPTQLPVHWTIPSQVVNSPVILWICGSLKRMHGHPGCGDPSSGILKAKFLSALLSRYATRNAIAQTRDRAMLFYWSTGTLVLR